jgi:hypothetical protein
MGENEHLRLPFGLKSHSLSLGLVPFRFTGYT